MIVKVEPLNGLPAFGGTIGLGLVTEVVLNEAEVDDVFLRDTEGNLCNNYLLVITHKDGSTTICNNLNEFAERCGLESGDGEVLLNSLNEMTSKFPFRIEETVHISYHETDSGTERGQQAYHVFLDARTYHITKNDENGQMLSSNLTPEQKAQMQEQIDMHLVVQNVFAKLAELIQTRFNQINFNDKAKLVGQFISEIRYWNDDGNIVSLNLNALDNFWTQVKGNIRIQ